MSLAGKPKMLKEVNSSMIERLIYKQGPLSKPRIAKITKLSMPTVNKIVDDLEKEGLICSVGLTTQGAGRKAVLYQINKDFGCVIVLYYFWGKYFSRISDMAGNTLHEELCTFDTSTEQTAVRSTVNAIDAMSVYARSEIKAIGIGVPGVVAPDGKLCGIPKIEVWEGFNLEEALSGFYDVDIYVENDVKLSTVGHYLTCMSDELDNMVYIYVGNGIGSGIIINKKLYHGSTNFSGELGFMAPLNGGSPRHNYTLEGGYLEKKLNPLIKHDRDTGKNNDNDNDMERILVNFLTAIAANYIAIINPNAIVFGGEAFDKSYVDEIRMNLDRYSPARSIPKIVYDDSDNVGVDGLVLACMGNITTEVQLVQNGGI